jgi:exosortase E/protease (VPEID-CTERM system)
VNLAVVPTQWRVVIVLSILIAQYFAISWAFDLREGWRATWIQHLFDLRKLLGGPLLVPSCLALFVISRLPTRVEIERLSADANPIWLKLLLVQLVTFLLFFVTMTQIAATFADAPQPLHPSLSIFFVVSGAGTLAIALLCLFQPQTWRVLIVRYRVALVLTPLVAVLVTLISQASQQLWIPRLASATFHGSAWLLALIYPEENILADPARLLLGVGGSSVHINYPCSGYEGIGLSAGFTTIYLWLFRDRLRFPRALLLLPLGVGIIWLSNVLRITLLLVIGHEISWDVAVGGFHSQAGIIFFVITSLLVLGIAHTTRPLWKPTEANASPVSEDADFHPSAHLLIPFIALMAMTLLTPAFSADFDWFYPARVLVVGSIIYLCWSHYRWPHQRPTVWSLVGGIVAFAVWMVSYPDDLDANATFQQHLESVPGVVAVTWLLLRSIGSIVTVPIAEELLFRGYVLSRLAGRPDNAEVGPLGWHLMAILGSAMLFGVLHGAWLSGTLAGVIYVLVRMKSGNLIDAIVAHAITNAMVTLYVITTQAWSYW